MFGGREVKVKLSSRLVIRFVVLGVKVHAGEGGQFEAYLAAYITDGNGGLEGPVVLSQVG